MKMIRGPVRVFVFYPSIILLWEDEKRLAHLFGDSYAIYRATVKRWIPGLF